MSAVDHLVELGGVASRAALIGCTSRTEVDRALHSGEIVVVARGRYSLPAVDESVRIAHALKGILSHSSAALHHGWEVKLVPEKPHVIVPRTRQVRASLAARATLHYVDLLPEEITDGIATSPELTLLQSLRTLADDEALAIADSALRNGTPPNVLRRVSAVVQGPGSAKVRRIAGLARSEAAGQPVRVLPAPHHVRRGRSPRRAAGGPAGARDASGPRRCGPRPRAGGGLVRVARRPGSLAP